MIKTWKQRCEEHPDHEGIVTEQMIRERMQEEIDELRQALAQPEQEFVGACVTCGAPKGEWLVDAVNISAECVDETAKREHEPFIYVREDNERPFGGYEHCSEADAGAFPVYTAPPKKEWVGLTDEDLSVCDEDGVLLARYWENKLKEKNT